MTPLQSDYMDDRLSLGTMLTWPICPGTMSPKTTGRDFLIVRNIPRRSRSTFVPADIAVIIPIPHVTGSSMHGRHKQTWVVVPMKPSSDSQLGSPVMNFTWYLYCARHSRQDMAWLDAESKFCAPSLSWKYIQRSDAPTNEPEALSS